MTRCVATAATVIAQRIAVACIQHQPILIETESLCGKAKSGLQATAEFHVFGQIDLIEIECRDIVVFDGFEAQVGIGQLAIRGKLRRRGQSIADREAIPPEPVAIGPAPAEAALESIGSADFERVVLQLMHHAGNFLAPQEQFVNALVPLQLQAPGVPRVQLEEGLAEVEGAGKAVIAVHQFGAGTDPGAQHVVVEVEEFRGAAVDVVTAAEAYLIAQSQHVGIADAGAETVFTSRAIEGKAGGK